MEAKLNKDDYFMLMHIDDFNNLVSECADKLTDIESNRCKYNGVLLMGHKYGEKGMCHPMPMRILEFDFNKISEIEIEIPKPEPRFTIGSCYILPPDIF